MDVRVAIVNDWLETETVRLSNLRDRASDMGQRKKQREFIEKLQILKTPEERLRRLEVPTINVDPEMDPSYVSDDDTGIEEKTQVPSNQPNMQQPQPLPNVTWDTMQGNPNIGWVGSVPGNPNMHWEAMIPGPVAPWAIQTGGNVQVQGPMPGNMNGGWVAAPVGDSGVNVQGIPLYQGWVTAPLGYPGVQMQGIPPDNQGWVAAPTQGPVVPVYGNPGWAMPTGNQGGISQVPARGNVIHGWGPPIGYQRAPAQGPTPGNANQGWGFPAASGDGFSGPRGSRGLHGGDQGRPWNRDNRGRQ